VDREKKLMIGRDSLGGAIVAHISSGPHGNLSDQQKAQWNRVLQAIRGTIVVDVVGGTALESLPNMTTLLSSRPTSFPSIPSAIQWTMESGLVKNSQSARISVPPQVVKRSEKDIGEDGNEYEWKTDLLSSEPYWVGWFTNLSDKFLASKGTKMLILAGTNRLDTELTIAQMQGKYQLILLPTCGHCIQEDDPQSIADHFARFADRYGLN